MTQTEPDARTRRPGAFTVRGHPLTALGAELRPGDAAPDAVLAGKGFVPQPVRIADYRGRVLILSCVPSIDARGTHCRQPNGIWGSHLCSLRIVGRRACGSIS